MKVMKIFTAVLIIVAGIQFQATSKEVIKVVPKKGPVYDFELKSKDSLDQDVLKILPKGSILAHKVTEGVFGPADGSKGPILIAPYTIGPKGQINLMLLIPAEKGKYKKMALGLLTFKAKKTVEIQSVFFDQADKDKERELFILCAVTDGKSSVVYETAVFSWEKTRFVRVSALEPKLAGRYPTIDVRNALEEISAAEARKAAKEAKAKKAALDAKNKGKK
jgi:hypothetical protein